MLGLPATPPVDLGVKFPDANPDAVDLLSKMLVLNPHRRISVEQALEHPYLVSLHDAALEPTAESHVDFRSIERVSPTAGFLLPWSAGVFLLWRVYTDLSRNCVSARGGDDNDRTVALPLYCPCLPFRREELFTEIGSWSRALARPTVVKGR